MDGCMDGDDGQTDGHMDGWVGELMDVEKVFG